jgi:hypothetical protein
METFLLKARRFARSHIEDDEPLVSHFTDGIARTFTANAVPRPFLILADMRDEQTLKTGDPAFSHPSPIPKGGAVLQYEILFDNAASHDHISSQPIRAAGNVR